MNTLQPPPLPPPFPVAEDEARKNGSHLQTLSVCYSVLGVLGFVCGSFPLIHFFLGFVIATGKMGGSNNAPPAALGVLFMGVALAVIATTWIIAALFVWTGMNLRKRQSWTLCMVAAGLACLNFPLGTTLGVFTFLVLSRDAVKREFGQFS